jgi:RNA polymerase sigma factor (sigma-70 family)
MPTQADSLLRCVRRIASQAGRERDDPALLRRFLTCRDPAAFAALVARHGPMVLRVCERVLGNRHDAEDAFQATFLILARKAAGIRPPGALAAWLHGVAYRVALGARAVARRRRREVPTPDFDPPDPTPDPLCALTARELLSALDEEVQGLPLAYRLPVVLCCLEGRTQEEAARQLGWTAGSVKGRLERARARLHARLVRRGLTLGSALATVELLRGTTSARMKLLAEQTVRAVLAFGAAGATGHGALSALAARLAVKELGPQICSGLKAVLLVVLGMILAGAAAGTLTLEPQAIAREAPASLTPPGSATRGAAGLEEGDTQQARNDRYGDPLPPGAVARLGTSRFWCGAGGRQQLAFAPNGKQIIVVDVLGVYVLEATTGKLLRHINTAAAKRMAKPPVSVSPDSKYLALALMGVDDNPEQDAQIYDLASGGLVREFRDAGPQQYQGAVFSPDGKMLASYSFNTKTLYLWEVATGKEVRRWPLRLGFGGSFTFSPNAKTLIAGDLRTIHCWDIATGTEGRRIEEHPGACIFRVALAQDGNVLATQALPEVPKVALEFGLEDQADSKVYLWDLAGGKRIGQIEVVPVSGAQRSDVPSDSSRVRAFRFSPDAKTLATASGDGMLRVWEIATGKELRRWHAGWVHSLAFSPDGKRLASAGGDYTVHLWDAATGKELREHPGHRSGFELLTLSPDGRTLASAGWDHEVHVWDMATGELRRLLRPDDGIVQDFHFSPDGRSLITLGENTKVPVWDIRSGQQRRQFQAPVEARPGRYAQATSPDGQTWVSVSVDGKGTSSLVLWDGSTGKKRRVLADSACWLGALTFSPGGETLYSCCGDKKVRLWDVATGKRLREFSADDLPGGDTGSFSPDGNWFARGNREGELLLYDVPTGTAVRRVTIPRPRRAPPCYAFSADGRTVAIGDEGGMIYLVEVASGKFRRRLAAGYPHGVWVLLFSSDGKRLVSGSDDTTALVWDLSNRPGARHELLSQADVAACWTDLAGEDAERADQAVRCLAASSTETVPYLEQQLRPAAGTDVRRLAGLIADLGSDRFRVRERAFQELADVGEAATAACRTALASKPSPEVYRRLEMLVRKQDQERWSPPPPRLRMLRAVEALELAGIPQARQLLQKLAAGAEQASLTQEAQAALRRLARRVATPP